MWSRISPYIPPAIIALLMLVSGQELVALRFAADAQTPADPLLATTAFTLGLIGVLLWAIYRLTRREGRIFVELFRSMLGMSVIVGGPRWGSAAAGRVWVICLPGRAGSSCCGV